ncbi:MAG TPA: 50S ribosomal protein L15 [Elusimicrobiales bacterium]|jgi:large subunit ribosomal protein L15|nr:50S ribosomal protein L15 [Elusimicrobiales bacterium]HOL61877.1 50S ribosomal protein L15 [Elusimicrobiales bacterium]HPO95095.1 50S ribosomal protein L15 [Elusimicrobiales bacterium]
MVFIHELSPKKGATHRKKRLGTGQGSGHGQTSTRGQKGQRARSGDPKRVGFEGGQMPLLRRLPKRGFNNDFFKKTYEIVKISTIEKNFNSGEEVNPEELEKKGIIKSSKPVKILGDGKLTKKLNVFAHAFSKSAKEIIEKAGGKVSLIEKKSANK